MIIVLHSNFLGLDVHYNAHNELYEFFSLFFKFATNLVIESLNK